MNFKEYINEGKKNNEQIKDLLVTIEFARNFKALSNAMTNIKNNTQPENVEDDGEYMNFTPEQKKKLLGAIALKKKELTKNTRDMSRVDKVKAAKEQRNMESGLDDLEALFK